MYTLVRAPQIICIRCLQGPSAFRQATPYTKIPHPPGVSVWGAVNRRYKNQARKFCKAIGWWQACDTDSGVKALIVFSYSNLCQFWTVLDCSEQPRPGRLKTMLTSQCGKTASSKATWNLLGSSSVNYVPHCSSLFLIMFCSVVASLLVFLHLRFSHLFLITLLLSSIHVWGLFGNSCFSSK